MEGGKTNVKRGGFWTCEYKKESITKTLVPTVMEQHFGGNSNALVSKFLTISKVNQYVSQSNISRLSWEWCKKIIKYSEFNFSNFYYFNLTRACMLEIAWITHVMRTSLLWAFI